MYHVMAFWGAFKPMQFGCHARATTCGQPLPLRDSRANLRTVVASRLTQCTMTSGLPQNANTLAAGNKRAYL